MMFSSHQKLTQDQTKTHNQRLVLKTIYRAGVCICADLARTTTSAVVDELLAAGLVAEIGHGPSAGGKSPTLLSLTADARPVIGVDLAGSELQGEVFDLRRKRLIHVTAPRNNGLDIAAGPALIDHLVAASDRPLLGIGIGLPGLIELEGGLVHQAVPTGRQELPLGEALKRRFEPFRPSQLKVPHELHFSSHCTQLCSSS